MKVLIVGARGMLGTDLMETFGSTHDVLGVDVNEMDITDRAQSSARIGDFHPDLTICAAALTDVDYCEAHPEEAFRVNAEGAGNVAAAAATVGSLIVHYSSDYVFDGRKGDPYREEDTPNPANVYGESKLRGDELVRLHAPNHLILRTSWLFGIHGTNFIRTIAARAREGRPLRVVNDQRGSPTYTRDLASYTLRMVSAGCRGLYNVTNSGSCSWHELALQALEWAGFKGVAIAAVTSAEFPSPAKRPANSTLANTRLEREGFPPMRPWQLAVQEYVKHLPA